MSPAQKPAKRPTTSKAKPKSVTAAKRKRQPKAKAAPAFAKHVALNGLFLTRPYTGMGQYTLGLMEALPKALPQAELSVIVPRAVDLPLSKRWQIRVEEPGRGRFGRLGGEGLALDKWERGLTRVASDLGADVYHSPYPTPAPEATLPTVMTVHDMIPFQLPYYRRSLRSRAKQRRILEGIQQADALVTVSETSAAAIVTTAGVPVERIQVAYEGLGPDFVTKPSAASVTKAKRQHGLDRPYVLYIGGFDYRKNVRRLIAGFGKSQLAESHDLLIAGAIDVPAGALYDDFHRLAQLIAQAGIGNSVRLIGHIGGAEKSALMKGAAAVCYPSLAEGFGLPILEALALGTPVATSRLDVTRELFTGAVEFFDPRDPSDLAAALRETVGRTATPMRKRGLAIAKEFAWPDTAARTAEVYRAVTGGWAQV